MSATDARVAELRRDAGNVVVRAIDAGVVDASSVDGARAIDAGTIDAAPALGLVTFAFDTWCDLSIDGVARGRASATPIELPAGRHAVACKQGLGQGSWADTIDVTGGAQRVDGSLLPPVEVENGLADAVRIRGTLIARGASAALRPGRQRVEIVRGGKVASTGWVTVPRVARCVLRDRPVLDCYP